MHHKLKKWLVRRSKHHLEVQYQKTNHLIIWTQYLIKISRPRDRKGFQIGSLQCLRIKLILNIRSIMLNNQVLQRRNYHRKTSLINLPKSYLNFKSQWEIDLVIQNQFKNLLLQSSHKRIHLSHQEKNFRISWLIRQSQDIDKRQLLK